MIGFLSVLLVDKHQTVNNVIATLAPVSLPFSYTGNYYVYRAEA